MLAPTTVENYHRVALVVFNTQDKEFHKYLKSAEARDEMKDMFL